MAHRHGGDIVCAVAANCSPCSSEPIPLLHFSPPPLFKPCPYSHYFISQPSLSPLSSPIPPILAVLLNYSIFFCGPSTGFKILALYGVIFLLVRIQRKVARRMIGHFQALHLIYILNAQKTHCFFHTVEALLSALIGHFTHA